MYSVIKLEYAGSPDNLIPQVVPQTTSCAGPSRETYAFNLTPVSTILVNAALFASGLAVGLSPGLTGFDFDGLLASYRIRALPKPRALCYNNFAISALTYAVADSALLSYTTPKHGSWLNMAEIEFSTLSRQCLNRRIGSAKQLEAEALIWQAHRNAAATKVNWSFITVKARHTLKNRYAGVTKVTDEIKLSEHDA